VGVFHHVVVGLAAATTFVPTRREPSSVGGSSAATSKKAPVASAWARRSCSRCWRGASEKGCRDVDALALPGDRLTKQRLEAAGFTARLLVLNRLLN
jgi:hypothetical protein